MEITRHHSSVSTSCRNSGNVNLQKLRYGDVGVELRNAWAGVLCIWAGRIEFGPHGYLHLYFSFSFILFWFLFPFCFLEFKFEFEFGPEIHQ
jgi:hypothetical protein